MKEPGTWGLKRSPQGGREGMKTANRTSEGDKWSDYKISVNTQPAKRCWVLGLVKLFPRNWQSEGFVKPSAIRTGRKKIYPVNRRSSICYHFISIFVPPKVTQDSFECWIPDSLSNLGLRIPIGDGISDSKAHDSEFQKYKFPGYRIPQAKVSWNPDSGLLKMGGYIL